MITQVKVPDLGDLASSAILVKWHVEKNSMVQTGDLLCSVETKKATVDVESPQTGVLTAIFAQLNDEVFIDDIIAHIETLDDENMEESEPPEEKDIFTGDLFASTHPTHKTPLETLIEEKKKTDQPQADQPKDEQPQIDQPKDEQPQADQPKNEQPQAHQPKDEQPQAHQPKDEQPQVDQPKDDQPQADQPKDEQPQAHQPKNEQPQADQPKNDQPQVDQPKGEQPQVDQPKNEQPQANQPKDEQPQAHQPKDEEQEETEYTVAEIQAMKPQTAVESFLSLKLPKEPKTQGIIEKFLSTAPLEEQSQDPIYESEESKIFGTNKYTGKEIPLQEVTYSQPTDSQQAISQQAISQQTDSQQTVSQPSYNHNQTSNVSNQDPLVDPISKLPIVKIPDQPPLTHPKSKLPIVKIPYQSTQTPKPNIIEQGPALEDITANISENIPKPQPEPQPETITQTPKPNIIEQGPSLENITANISENLSDNIPTPEPQPETITEITELTPPNIPTQEPPLETITQTPLASIPYEKALPEFVEDSPSTVVEVATQEPLYKSVYSDKTPIVESKAPKKANNPELTKNSFLLNPEEIILSSSPNTLEYSANNTDNENVSYLFEKIRESSLINDENHMADTENAVNKHSHISLFQTVDVTDLLALIVDYAEDVHKQHGFNLNILPFVIKSLTNTLNLMPRITHNEKIDLEVSLNTQKFGYISPTLNNLGQDTIIQIAKSLSDIQQRAEEYKLLPADFKGSKFIIYDNRNFNIRASTPVLDINHIIGISLHGINEKLVPQDSNIIVAKTIELSLSFDQNHVLFEVASLVLDKIKTQLEEPQNLLQNF